MKETRTVPDYEKNFYTSLARSNRAEPMSSKNHLKLRGKYYGRVEGKADKDDYGFEAVIVARGKWLVKEHPELGDNYRKYGDLNKLARKYVKDDYMVSPRTARQIIYYALERLVDADELRGINPDPLQFIPLEPKESKTEAKKQKKIVLDFPVTYPASVASRFPEGVLVGS